MDTIIFDPSNTSITQHNQQIDTRWLQFFDIKQAIHTVANHVAGLPSSDTPEQHTSYVYSTGLKYFINWSGPQLTGADYKNASLIELAELSYTYGAHMPTKNLIKAYIAHLKVERGLKAVTIGSKYLAPIRHYMDALIDQSPAVDGEDWVYIFQCKERISSARRVKNPQRETKTDKAPLEQHGVRLSYAELSTLYERMAQDTDNLTGLRNYAIITTAFDTCLRVAELARMTLNSITKDEDSDVYLVTVRGKRNNYTSVPLGADVYQIILDWVEAYNHDLAPDDPRRINADTALWQPLLHGSNHAHVGTNGYDPQQGMADRAIRNIFKRVSHQYRIRLDHDGQVVEFKPHDARRTTAKMMRDMGAEIEDIQEKLRHESPVTTAKYIGRKKDRNKANTANYIDFEVIQNQAHKKPPTPPQTKEMFTPDQE